MPKNDSQTQIKQEQENKAKRNGQDTNGDGNFDKKLDGPNRPSV
jgi:hypothetical protein